VVASKEIPIIGVGESTTGRFNGLINLTSGFVKIDESDFLRKTGLDELPQLFNVLSNKMSLVGPRPLLIKYLKFKNFQKHERRKCKPGITGLAQIQSFINSNSKRRKSKWQIQFTLDRQYFHNMSLNLDIIILYKTVLKFFKFNKVDYFSETRLLNKHIK
jgi:lipopolysaccharide/colanic/teichoic acid biosynthesis glycosyltransferase